MLESFLEGVINLSTGGAIGSLIGIAGAWITKREERATLRIRNEHEQAMARLKVSGEIQTQDARAFTESQKTKSTIADAIRAVVRPIITIYLLTVTTWLAYVVWTKTKGIETWETGELEELIRLIISQLLFLTTTCVVWWFGARPSSERYTDARFTGRDNA